MLITYINIIQEFHEVSLFLCNTVTAMCKRRLKHGKKLGSRCKRLSPNDSPAAGTASFAKHCIMLPTMCVFVRVAHDNNALMG